MNPLIQELTQEQLRTDIPAFRPGDTVRVHAKVVEGTRERIQLFEGVVIKRRGAGISETYKIKKVTDFPEASTLDGFYAFGTDGGNNSVILYLY